MRVSLVLLLAFCATSNAFLESVWGSGQEWNGLKAGFGINPLTSFWSLPRTVSDAVSEGWALDRSVVCGGSNKYAGNRYIKKGDPGAMLLFGKNGYIAGIQAGIPKEADATKYPNPNNALYKVFNEEANMMVVTAYFTDPSTICSAGRSKADFDKSGTGTMLAFQTGPSINDLMRIPIDEQKVTTTTKFVKGKCFYTMGMHYWYDLTGADMSCDKTFPVFLLYNKGKLNGFGWAFNPNYSNSDGRRNERTITHNGANNGNSPDMMCWPACPA